MKFLPLLSTLLAGLCLALSLWLFAISRSNHELQSELQRQQDSLQAQQLEVQLRQQQLQTQQDQINVATQLAQQVGPAVLRELGSLVIENKNKKIEGVLTKHGISVTKNPDPANSTPRPALQP